MDRVRVRNRVIMSGKGDRPRPIDKSKFDENFDRIFNKRKGERKHGDKTNTNKPGKTTAN